MAEEENPYAPPGASLGSAEASGATLSAAAVKALRRTGFWTRVCAVLGIIGGGVMLLGGIVTLVGDLSAVSTAFAAGQAFGIFAARLIVVVLVLLPVTQLWRVASSVHRTVAAGDLTTLEGALRAQGILWLILGIFAVLVAAFAGVSTLIYFIATMQDGS